MLSQRDNKRERQRDLNAERNEIRQYDDREDREKIWLIRRQRVTLANEQTRLRDNILAPKKSERGKIKKTKKQDRIHDPGVIYS